MRWAKKGFIYGPDGTMPWAKDTALTPTPILLNEETIRVYSGFRDEFGVSRIGFVDLESKSPNIVKCVSSHPALDIGRNGAFDDNGVILGDVIRVDDEIRMYYVGFQLVSKVKFLAFSGLAISNDGGDTFERYSHAPIMDRANESLFIRAIHSIIKIGDQFHIWYASGNEWEIINGTPYPQYRIRHAISNDGLNIGAEGNICVDVEGLEYRIGRPRVFQLNNKFFMHYTRGTTDGQYLAGLAESLDGVHWKRIDSELGITLSESGWDSRHLCYPALLTVNGKTYMFYNGNNMGKEGFGYAELEAE
jgi:predicted GH43/DUF377 family glycosyl hydrolase